LQPVVAPPSVRKGKAFDDIVAFWVEDAKDKIAESVADEMEKLDESLKAKFKKIVDHHLDKMMSNMLWEYEVEAIVEVCGD
jgi:uncharacterized ferredoxin-like protein